MRHLTVILPKGLVVDVYELPEDFESKVQKAFGEFTEETAKDYTFMDKLRFIDLASYYLHGGNDEETAVRELIHNKLDYDLDEYGTFPDESDYLSTEFMEMCYSEGRRSQRLDSDGFKDADSYKDREQIEKMLCRFIKAVIDYKGGEEE